MHDWLPEGPLASFVVEMMEQFDLTSIKSAYAGRGSKAHHPEMLLALPFYGYATGVLSSRKLERAIYDSVAFRYIAANDHLGYQLTCIAFLHNWKKIQGVTFGWIRN